MNLTTREFLANREAEIISQMKDLRDELREIRDIKGALIVRNNPEMADKVSSGLTFQDMIVAVLNGTETGAATALEILDLIDKKFEKKILRSSISPQLSRLKDKGVLNLDNGNWTLTTAFKAQKAENPAEAGPSKELGEASALLDLIGDRPA